MRASRHHIFFILTFFAFFLFSAYAENEVEGAGGGTEDGLKDVASLAESFVGPEEEEQQQHKQQQPMDAIVSMVKKLVMSLAYTEKEGKELQAALAKAFGLKKRSEDILEKMEEVVHATKAVDTPEKKAELKRDIHKYSKELQETIAECLVLVLKSAGVKPKLAEKAIKENAQLSHFFQQLELLLSSRLEGSGFA